MSVHNTNYNQAYRRGTIFGLTVAEILILLLFIVLMLFLPLIQPPEDPTSELARIKKELIENRALARHTSTELETLTQEIQKLQLVNRETMQTLTQKEQQAEQLQTEIVMQREKISELEQKNRILKVKGQNPPCWYQIITETNGKTREKAHYIFDVAVFDDYMDVRKRTPPPGSAEDDGGRSYAEEMARFELSKIPFETKMSDKKFVEHFRPLFYQGKKSQVRTYSCIFSIRVWDKTSPDAKLRWRKAHERVLQGLFGTYLVEDTPWSYPPL